MDSAAGPEHDDRKGFYVKVPRRKEAYLGQLASSPPYERASIKGGSIRYVKQKKAA